VAEAGERNRARRWRARPEKWWWISGVVVLPVLVLTGIAVLLLLGTTHPATAAERVDVAKTALSVGAGTGGVVALVLTGRRQWHLEQAQRATEKSQQAVEYDAAERRITELYGKAVQRLGSDKAPVRLGGLHALERLAQDNPGQRQTIVDVICAYLRMPYELPKSGAPRPSTVTGSRPHRNRAGRPKTSPTVSFAIHSGLDAAKDLRRQNRNLGCPRRWPRRVGRPR
jgi:hypothetical protein